MDFWSQITSLNTFNSSIQRAKHIVHPCWRIAHRVLTTSICDRLEPGQINRCELFFLDNVSHRRGPNFSTFFLDKYDVVRQRTSGEIYIREIIIIIGRSVSLDFPAPNYISVDSRQPNFLLDCDTLKRMDMLEDRGNDIYSWLDGDKHAVYILPS